MPRAVLIVGNFASAWGGVPGPCESLAVRLAESGWRVITTSRYKQRCRRLLDMVWVTWKHHRDYSVACVDVFSGLAAVWAAVVCAVLIGLGRPYIMVLHGGGLPPFLRGRGRFLAFFMRRAAAVVAQTEYLARCARPHATEVKLIPNALDLSKYSFRLRRTVRPELIWVRSFHRTYNPQMAVEVLSLLAQDEPEARLTMVGPDRGDGSLAQTLARARELGVESRLRVAGPVPKAEIPRWLDQADIFLNTTDIDNTPVSVEEAMASGLCVVSTNVGGLPYMLEEGQTALMVPPGQSATMAEAVRKLLQDPELAEHVSASAREWAMALDWERVIAQWGELLDSVASAREGRDE